MDKKITFPKYMRYAKFQKCIFKNKDKGRCTMILAFTPKLRYEHPGQEREFKLYLMHVFLSKIIKYSRHFLGYYI